MFSLTGNAWLCETPGFGEASPGLFTETLGPGWACVVELVELLARGV